MNAPISLALRHLFASAPAAPMVQPLVPATARLLCNRYEHGGLLVDLYGALDAAGYDVQHVIVADDERRIDIGVTYSREVLRQMGDWCDRHLNSAQELGLVSQQEAAAERAHWERSWPP